MGVENAWNPLLVAIVATMATTFQFLAGFLNCDFIRVSGEGDEVLAIVESSEQEVVKETSIGLLCDGDFYDLEGDDMRMYSRLFYYGATGVGCLSMMGAWAISTCVTPTLCAWRIIPALASISALTSLPVFLILESYPCDDFAEQSCSLSWDSYYWIAAAGIHIVVTALTQFLDPPEWISQLHHWRLQKVRTMETNQWSSSDEEGSQDPILTPRLQPPRSLSSWFERRHRRRSERKAQIEERVAPRQAYSYALPTRDMEQADSLVEEEVDTQESADQLERKEAWIPFEPTDFSKRESNPLALVDASDSEPRAMVPVPATQALPPVENQQSPGPLVAPSIPERHKQDQEFQQSQPKIPVTPQNSHRRVEQVPISPLTHQTSDSTPASPSIERTTVQDPVLRLSRASTPSRSSVGRIDAANAFLNETQISTPVKKLDWSQVESVLDGIVNGDESLLDQSMERATAKVPFIPTPEESKRMATHGYSIYADLDRESSANVASKSAGPPEYNIDELVNRPLPGTSTESSMSLLGPEDVKVIAKEGTPIYASLLLEQDGKITRQFAEENDVPDSPKETERRSLSTEAYMLQKAVSSGEEKRAIAEGEANNGVKTNWNLAVLRRTNSGYDKLDDISLSDEEAGEEPPMTEVSFDPNEIQEVSLDKDEIHQTKNKSEAILLDEWNKMFDARGPVPVKMKEIPDEEEEEDRKDEEELLRLISKEDFSDKSPKNQEKGGAEEDRADSPSTSSSSTPEKPPRSGGKTTLRPKRRARRSRSRASGSVGSSPSLLEVTIEEETASDLEEFNKEELKSTKTPLSGFAAESGNKNKNVSTSVNMTGMHSYHSVEHLRSDEMEKITAGVQEALRRSRGRSQGSDIKDKAHTVRSLSPSTTRVSAWRSERENRGGIHAPVVATSSYEDDPGTQAKDLRRSRIQRLQQLSTPEITALVRAKVRRDRNFGEFKSPYEAPVKRLDKTFSRLREAETPTMPRQKKDPPVVVSPFSTGDDGSNTTTPDDVGEVGSFLIGALNLELHDLDASLAALSRPDDSDMGPDERSI